MTAIDVIGIMAGTLTTIAFVPQVFKVWRSRSAEDVSLLMFALFNKLRKKERKGDGG